MANNYNKMQVITQFQWRKLMWIWKIIRLSESSIYWEGLPESIDKVYLENCLTRTGSAIIMYDDVAGIWVNGQNASAGTLDIYGYPTMRSIIFRNGKQMWTTPDKSVIIYNNDLRTSDFFMFELYAEDLADYDMAIRVNMNTQKTMPIIPIKPDTALTAKNIMQDYIENIPYHLVDPNTVDTESLKSALVFDNARSFTADKMIKVQREMWNRILTMIGVNNTNVEKAERVNTFETNSNLDEIFIFRRGRINAREEGAKRMRELWGWNVRVGYYSDRNGGGTNGGLYSGIENSTETDLA